MTLKDFKAHFMLLVICKLTPGLLSQEVGQKWACTLREGKWEKGSTAGGRMKSPRGKQVHRTWGSGGLECQLGHSSEKVGISGASS